MKKPQGIGGWLILPTIGFVLGMILWTLAMFLAIFLVATNQYEPVDIVTIILTPFFIPFLAYSIYLELKKKKEFKKWAIITLWVSVLFVTILSTFDGAYIDIAKELVASSIWTWYFLVSKRVKNTFTK